MVGRPGCTYIEVPGDMLRSMVSENEVVKALTFNIPKTMACPQRVQEAAELLKSAKQPLIIVGKGAALGRAEKEVRALVNSLNIPFLPTPMGKGVVSDSNRLNVSAARSMALKEADVVVLLGCRLNWILHFGLPPRFKASVRFI